MTIDKKTIVAYIVIAVLVVALTAVSTTLAVKPAPAPPAPQVVEKVIEKTVVEERIVYSPIVPPPNYGYAYASYDEIWSVLRAAFPTAYLNIRSWGTYSLPATGWAYGTSNTVTVTICRDSWGNLQVTIRDPKDGRTDVLSAYHQFRATRVDLY